MISNENVSVAQLFDGKRHYVRQKPTSLFGSESPRIPKNKTNNIKTNTISADENILTQYEILRKDREINESRLKNKGTLQETESYDPWNKSRIGAGISNQSDIRDKWEYEQEIKRVNDYKKNDEKAYPGFAPGFGGGNIRKDGRFKSDMSSNGDEGRQNLYYPFGSAGGGAPISEDSKKALGATVTIHRKLANDNDSFEKLDESKLYADQLEQEIQKMRIKQMNDRYSSIKNSVDGGRQEIFDNYDGSEYEANSLYRDAENRARLRELERFKDESNEKIDSFNERSNVLFNSRNNEMASGPLQLNGPKRVGSSATHNDYRLYSLDEFTNSRQQLINPVQLKRTTLSGSENLYQTEKTFEEDVNNAKMRQYSVTNTYNNIFPSERVESASKATGPYFTKAPWATD